MSISELNITESVELELPDDKPDETVNPGEPLDLSSVEEIMRFIGERAARVIRNYPSGVGPDDIRQAVALRLIENGDLGTLSQAIEEGKTGLAVNMVKYPAIDATRESSEPGSSVFTKTVKDLRDGKPIEDSSHPLGQAARRRAYMYYKGTPRQEADEHRDEFGTPKGSVFEDPEEAAAYQEMLTTLMEGVPSLRKGEKGMRNKKLVEMYLEGYPLPEIAEILGIPHGTAKGIWRNFRQDAERILLSNGYSN